MTAAPALLCLLFLGTPPGPTPTAVATTLTWSRVGSGGIVEVDATRPGPALDRAHGEVEAVADRLDALRTIRPHVVWTFVRWRRGVIEAKARADSGIHANVAILALRALMPGYGSHGSGMRHRSPPSAPGYPWDVRILLAPPTR